MTNRLGGDKMKKYNGTDFSADWKVVTYEGSVILAPWALVTDSKTKDVFVVRKPDANLRPLVGFSNYRLVAAAARMFGGTAVRE